MSTNQSCPECGAPWTDGSSCQDYFHQMGFWEIEHMSVNGVVHHLMVLCYHLQHPSLYAPDGLRHATGLLVDFVERGVSPQTVRIRDRDKVDSGRRKFKIKATADSHGAYAHPVVWTMTAADVIARGEPNYVASVRAWAQSVLDALKASGNL